MCPTARGMQLTCAWTTQYVKQNLKHNGASLCKTCSLHAPHPTAYVRNLSMFLWPAISEGIFALGVPNVCLQKSQAEREQPSAPARQFTG